MINKLFALSLVYMESIAGVAISNIIYYIYALKNGVIAKKEIFLDARFIFFYIFVFWVTFSTISYILYSGNFDDRVLVKYLFVYQYIILILPIKINKYCFELTLYWIVILFTIIFISLFFILSISEGLYFDLLSKSWAYDYIPGFPNSIPLILIFGLWISFHNKFGILGKMLIYFSLYLTLSRGAQLIAFFISLYFIFIRYERLINMKFFLSTLVVSIISLFLYVIYSGGDGIFSYLYDIDRLDLYQYAFKFIEQSPIMGFGGNTLDQLRDVHVSYVPIFEWEHTHNWIFEFILRYGFVGASLFIFFLGSVFLNIKKSELKFMFFIYLFYAFFQTFMQNFIYIFILSYFATYNDINSHSKKF
jgi:O-antigen ligase